LLPLVLLNPNCFELILYLFTNFGNNKSGSLSIYFNQSLRSLGSEAVRVTLEVSSLKEIIKLSEAKVRARILGFAIFGSCAFYFHSTFKVFGGFGMDFQFWRIHLILPIQKKHWPM